MSEADPPTGNGQDDDSPLVAARGDAAGWPTPDESRAALTRVLSSATFAHTVRLSRFLRFVAREALAGRGDLLKEYVVAVEVFDRPASFRPAEDSIVRVEARRLRAKLAEYYAEEGSADLVAVTLPRGGYAPVFVRRAATRTAPAPANAPAAEPATSAAAMERAPETSLATGDVPQAPRHNRYRVIGWAALGLLAVSAILLAYLWRTRAPSPSVVAVLPFDTLSGVGEDAYFSFGLVEELTSRLALVPEIRVVARTSASQYARGADVATLARRLKANAVVEGSVRREGANLRVTAQLIDASTGHHLWARSYDAVGPGAFDLQDDVARDAASAIAGRLTGRRTDAVAAEASAMGGIESAALAEYWKGRYHRSQRTPEGRRRSVAHFEQALAYSPSFAAAHSALGEVYSTLAFHAEVPVEEGVARARTEAARALDLDATLAEAHNTLAWIRFFHDWDWERAEQGFERAIALNPSFANAHQLFALALASRGRFDEAIRHSAVALQLDPLSYMVTVERAAVFYCARRYDESIHHALRALEVSPEATPVHGVLGSSYAARGQYQEALVEFERSLAAFGRISYVLARMGHAYAKLGRLTEARQLCAELEAAARRGEPVFAHLALLYTTLGDRDQAIEALQRASAGREADVVFAGVEPLLDPLRGDPRFDALLSRLGLGKVAAR